MITDNYKDSKNNLSTKLQLGIDIGSVSSKALILANKNILAWEIIPSVGKLEIVAQEIIKRALTSANISVRDISTAIATGYGANCVSLAAKSINDMTCHGRGVHELLPNARTIVDIGGQFSRAIRIDSSGKIKSFVMSEKCAAGSGHLLQIIAKVLNIDMQDMSKISTTSTNKINFTTSCAVFIESEVVSRIAEGALKEDIVAGIYRSLATKIQSLLERLGFEPDLALVGGGAKNTGLVSSIEELLGIKAFIPFEPQIVAALGAALLAEEEAGI